MTRIQPILTTLLCFCIVGCESGDSDTQDGHASAVTRHARDTIAKTLTIKVGMDHVEARKVLSQRGTATKMALNGDHDAYVLNDDLTVVIAGDETAVDTIIVVTGFGRGKAHRDYEYVEEFTY